SAYFYENSSVAVLPSSFDDGFLPNILLHSNYPNPFNPTTMISFSTTESTENTELSIYNIKGQKVKTLVNDKLEVGDHSLVWNGKDDSGKQVTSGIYFYKLKSGRYTATKKMILMK
ncbi:MAG: T9SS type A sorting domain-containing protein, partial [Candidatus Cloacimonetes bacterium]|nr:T9SS type A sorting domain-containing protein [Candidatus Cloacimonadota bacterium]